MIRIAFTVLSLLATTLVGYLVARRVLKNRFADDDSIRAQLEDIEHIG